MFHSFWLSNFWFLISWGWPENPVEKSWKNYAKHCFNHERTLPISSLNLDVDPYRKLCMHNCQKIEKLWPSGCSDVSAHPSRRNHNWNWSLYQKMPSYLLKPKIYVFMVEICNKNLVRQLSTKKWASKNLPYFHKIN